VAVKFWERFFGSSTLPGVIEVETACTINPAKFEAEVLNTEVAVMVTARSLAGGVAGAV
jgi:hypothetical protein